MARRTPPKSLIGSGLIPQSFQDQYNAAQGEYETNIAGLGRDERSLFRDFGFTGGINDQGGVNFQVDPTANYGQYQSFIRNLGGQLQAARAQRSGRGLGKKGLARARENLIRFLGEGDRAGLVSNLTKQASGIFGARGQARSARDRVFGQLEGGALDWWNQYGPEDPDPVAQSAPPGGWNVGGQNGGSIGSLGFNISPETAQAAGVSSYYPTVQEVTSGQYPDPLQAGNFNQPAVTQGSYIPELLGSSLGGIPPAAQAPVYDPYATARKRQTVANVAQ